MGFPVQRNWSAYGQRWVSAKAHWFKPLRQEEGPVPDVARSDSPPQGCAGTLDWKMMDYLFTQRRIA